MMAFLFFGIVYGIDTYWTQQQLDDFDIESMNYTDFNPTLLTNPYIQSYYILTNFSVISIEKTGHPVYQYHIFEPTYTYTIHIETVVNCIVRYSPAICKQKYIKSIRSYGKGVIDSNKERALRWQTQPEYDYSEWLDGFEW